MRARSVLVVGFALGVLVAGAVWFAAAGWGNPFLRPAAVTLASPTASAASSAPSASPTSAPAHVPQARVGAAYAYDPENSAVVMFGGVTITTSASGTNGVMHGDTWLWSKHSWRQLDLPGPSARQYASAAYDSVRHVVVLFGGSGDGGTGPNGDLQDTWTWNGSSWVQQNPAHVPDPRFAASMAFDERRGTVVLFGGQAGTQNGITTYHETWTWNGLDWTLQNPAATPGSRHFAGMAYDADQGVTVLLGGSMPGMRLNDTWTWDGTTWTPAGTAPGAGGWTSLAYDAATRQVVAWVYLGIDSTSTPTYTLTWDGTGWTDRSSATQPSSLVESAVVYDAAAAQVVLFDCSLHEPDPVSETWMWDGTAWTNLT
jgi:hypothetical protein